MRRSILDFNVVQPGHESAGAEPTIRELIHRYYADHIHNEDLVAHYSNEYIRQIEDYERKETVR